MAIQLDLFEHTSSVLCIQLKTDAEIDLAVFEVYLAPVVCTYSWIRPWTI